MLFGCLVTPVTGEFPHGYWFFWCFLYALTGGRVTYVFLLSLAAALRWFGLLCVLIAVNVMKVPAVLVSVLLCVWASGRSRRRFSTLACGSS